MDKTKKKIDKKYWGVFLAGFLWGITFTFVFGVIFLRHSLINEYQSKFSFNKTLQEIKNNTEQTNGEWILRFNKSCSLPKASDKSRIIQIELCSNKYSSRIINKESSRKASAIIPSTFSIYEKSDGKTYISQLNSSLIGHLVGGDISKIFARKIYPEQQIILKQLIK